MTSGSGTGSLDLTTPPTGTVSGTGETITFSWASASAPPPSGFLTSTTTVASETSYKSGADPIGICPPTPAMIEAGIPFCQERFDYSGSGPTVGTPDVEYAGQAVPTTTTPTVALSSGSGSIGSSVGVTDATNACPATIGTGSAGQNFFDGTYNPAGTSVTGTYNCWYGRAGDATPVTVTVDGVPATVTPKNPSNGDVSEAFYDVDGPNDTSTYDGAGTITLMSVASGSNTVSCGASSAGTAVAPYGELLGDAVSGTDIPAGTEVTNVVNSASHTCSLTLSNAATATPAAETLTFYAVTLNPPQLSANFTVPANTPTGPQTVEVCEATTPTNGFDWEFGVQSIAPAGSLQYVSGNSGPTEICGTSTIIVSLAPSSVSTTVDDAATNASWTGSETTGASAYDTSSVGEVGGIAPTGTVTYDLFSNDPNDLCASTPTQTWTESVGANSGATGPLADGNYSFQATYSGDGNYGASTSTCESFSVGLAPTSLSTTVDDAATNAPWTGSETTGASAYDTSSLSGEVGGIAPTGTVGYSLFSNSTCTGTPTQTWSESLGADSGTTGPLAKGTYGFEATYPGDGNYSGYTSACEPFALGETLTSISTTVDDAGTNAPWTGNETTGASAYDTSSLSGEVGGIAPTGTVGYSLFSNDLCAGTPTQTWSESVGADSSTTGPLAGGDYSFQAIYSGDGNYVGSTSPCEPFTVASVPSSISTTVTDASTNAPWAGTEEYPATAYDTSSLRGQVGAIAPTGTVTYDLFSNDPNDLCAGTPTETWTESVGADSGDSAALAAGNYSFQATYSGDSSYQGSTSSCESFKVLPTLSISPNPAYFTEGQSGSTQATSQAGETVTYSETGAPGSITIGASSGTLSGMPGWVSGPFTVTVTAAAGGVSTSESFTLYVVASNQLHITTTSLPGATIGTAYSARLTAAGGTPRYHWSISSGTLPRGLHLNRRSGKISGTPAANAVSETFTVKVTDHTATPHMTATASFTITVT